MMADLYGAMMARFRLKQAEAEARRGCEKAQRQLEESLEAEEQSFIRYDCLKKLIEASWPKGAQKHLASKHPLMVALMDRGEATYGGPHELAQATHLEVRREPRSPLIVHLEKDLRRGHHQVVVELGEQISTVAFSTYLAESFFEIEPALRDAIEAAMHQLAHQHKRTRVE